jgi:serine/threonine-protein kinase
MERHPERPDLDPGLAETQLSGGDRPATGADTFPSDPPAGMSGDETVAADGAAHDIDTAHPAGAPVHAGTSLAIGADAARYAAGPLLGVGGMGEVTLVLDGRIGRPVAKKTLRADVASERALARFVREGRVQGQLEHPSIVPVYDLGADGQGRAYFTMKRVRGQTLAHVIERLDARDPDHVARFSRRKLLGAFTQVCQAVEYAHERGVLHRDLKPQNVMLGDFGEVYVLDWGVAKLVGEAADPIAEPSFVSGAATPEVTRAGDLLGTPLYMAPEQIAKGGPAALDVRADVYALGAILFEILTLEPYRRGDSIAKIFAQATSPDVERPSARVADVPPELDAICARALAPDPEHRLPTAKALAEAVDAYLEGDRDLEARRTTAAALLADARAALDKSGREDALARVRAMREALKALALVPDSEDAQRLLLSLVVDGSGKLPPAGEAEFAEGDVEARAQGLRLGIAGYASWLLSWPLALWVGVRDWSMPVGLTVMTLVCVAYAVVTLRRGARSMRQAVVLSALSSATVAFCSSWLGPFVLVPIAACATGMMFVVHCTRRERPWLIATWVLALLVPYAIELAGVAPPAYSFRPGELVLHARSLELPRGPTLAALAYTSVTFVVLLAVFVGRLRDKQREAERRLFVQAWHLRQLFPGKG